MPEMNDTLQKITAAEKAKTAALSEAERLTAAISAALDMEDTDKVTGIVDGRQQHIEKMQDADSQTAALTRALPEGEKALLAGLYAAIRQDAGNNGEGKPENKGFEWCGELWDILCEQRAVLGRITACETENRDRMEKLMHKLRGQMDDMKKNRGIMDKYLPDQTLPAGTVYFEKK